MAERCIGGIEAVQFFESLPVPEGQEETRLYALNRIKYEAAKGIGVKPKVFKGIYRWHGDTQNCGNCGSGISEAWFNYCPNCGTAILKNDYTEKRVKEIAEQKQMNFEDWLNIIEAERTEE
jgi:predicted RNA-binding Zn-ribbon protein involved in translation (DUF1610 family)